MMGEFTIIDKLLINSASQDKNNFLYNGDRTAVAKKKRKIFFDSFSSAIKKSHNITIKGIFISRVIFFFRVGLVYLLLLMVI